MKSNQRIIGKKSKKKAKKNSKLIIKRQSRFAKNKNRARPLSESVGRKNFFF
jgi:hypothetical protein